MKHGKLQSQRASKYAKIYVGRSTTVHDILFCAHTLCMVELRNRNVTGTQLKTHVLCMVKVKKKNCEQKHYFLLHLRRSQRISHFQDVIIITKYGSDNTIL